MINNPCNTTSIQRLFFKFKTTFTFLDQLGHGRKSLADYRTPSIAAAVESTLSSMSSSSIRRISNETNIPISSVQLMLRNHLNLHPYRLHESDKEQRLQF